MKAKKDVGRAVEAEQSQKAVLFEPVTDTGVLSTEEIQHSVLSEPATGTEQSLEIGCSREETVILKDSNSFGGDSAVRQLSGTSNTV